ncbi:MarR family transcriptional regulator [Virgibacillus halophilus]|uniref:MarR family transcriptional regulator n=1 Tax=Tigheibacillus halophilus TaxID=361280 RepID=A0ABU5C5F2_9BACI|nr:MarR family transcriptional regulator [Virgibacillus halophilus]
MDYLILYGRSFFYIEQNGSSQLASISAYYHIERPSITRVVQRLEEKQIVEQIPGKDKRGKSIRLTKFGLETYRICRKKITELEHSMLSDVPEEMKQNAFDLFPQIREKLITSEEDKREPKVME